MITARKIAITISEMLMVNTKKEVDGELPIEVAVGVEVEAEVVEDEEVGSVLDGELRGKFAGIDIVSGLLQGLAVPVKS